MLCRRPSTITLTKSLIVLISYIPALHSRPTNRFSTAFEYHDIDGFAAEDIASSQAFWWKLAISVSLVLIGGVFSGIRIMKLANSGLTLALLSQDEITVHFFKCGCPDYSSYKFCMRVVIRTSKCTH